MVEVLKIWLSQFPQRWSLNQNRLAKLCLEISHREQVFYLQLFKASHPRQTNQFVHLCIIHPTVTTNLRSQLKEIAQSMLQAVDRLHCRRIGQYRSIWKPVTQSKKVIHSSISKDKTLSFITWRNSSNQASKERSKRAFLKSGRNLEGSSLLKGRKFKFTSAIYAFTTITQSSANSTLM